jgi:hypothetical protein
MALFGVLNDIKQALQKAFGPPDPLRFAAQAVHIPNWHGELEGSKSKRRTLNERVVLINEDTQQFEFPETSPYEGMDIPGHLTEKDVSWLKGKNLDPKNGNYLKAKQYFAKNPGCSKQEMAKASGIAPETAKDVVSGFRKNILQ